MKIFAVAAKNRLYECLDRIDAHRAELFIPLQARWKDLFGAAYDLLLYDLTSTYFEGAMEQTPSGPTSSSNGELKNLPSAAGAGKKIKSKKPAHTEQTNT